jgi:hypothetical protein
MKMQPRLIKNKSSIKKIKKILQKKHIVLYIYLLAAAFIKVNINNNFYGITPKIYKIITIYLNQKSKIKNFQNLKITTNQSY